MAHPIAWFYFPYRAEGYSMLSYDIIPYTDAGSVYWACQYEIMGTGSGGYCGLQTKGANDLPVPEAKAINFSQWDVFSGEAGYIEPCLSRTFTGEGDGWNVHTAYPWVVGKRYRIQFRIGADNAKIMATINGQGIGAIPVPAGSTTGLFGNGHRIWGEDYGTGSGLPARCLVKNFYAGYSFADNRDTLVAAELIDPIEAEMAGAATMEPKDGGYEMYYYAKV